MMKTWQILLLSFAGVCALVLGSSLAGGHRGQLPQRTPEIVTVTPQRTPAPGEFTNYYTEQRVKAAEAILEDKLGKANFTVSYRYDNVNGYVFYDLVSPEINRDFIQFVKDNMELHGEDWNTISRELARIQSLIQDTFTDAGDDTLVIIDILNPDNTDEVWLSVANGIAGYDVVNGIDLLNDQD